ncbi:MAG TPA: hypothetical protein P5123_00065 [Spirochaetota bacterium]|nr:hypothetical protein [Spirochaetota bacterium]
MTGTMTAQSSIYLSKKLTAAAKKLGERELITLVRKAESLLDQQKSFRDSAKTNPLSVTVSDSTDGNSFRLLIGSTPKVFQRYEMRKMVKLCQKADNRIRGSQKLKIWLRNNRPDFFLDHKIGNNWDLALAEIYDYLINNYTVQ